LSWFDIWNNEPQQQNNNDHCLEISIYHLPPQLPEISLSSLRSPFDKHTWGHSSGITKDDRINRGYSSRRFNSCTLPYNICLFELGKYRNMAMWLCKHEVLLHTISNREFITHKLPRSIPLHLQIIT
jgi:hypothetical protein